MNSVRHIGTVCFLVISSGIGIGSIAHADSGATPSSLTTHATVSAVKQAQTQALPTCTAFNDGERRVYGRAIMECKWRGWFRWEWTIVGCTDGTDYCDFGGGGTFAVKN